MQCSYFRRVGRSRWREVEGEGERPAPPNHRIYNEWKGVVISNEITVKET